MQARSERATDVLLCALLAAVGAATYAGFFAGWSFAAPLAAAAFVPAVLVAARPGDRPARTGGWVGCAVLVGLLPLFVAVTLRVFPGTGVSSPADALAVTGRGLASGWDAMLAAARPADPTGDLLVTPLALTWLASAGACLLAVHRRGPLVPVAPPALALVAALALTGDAGTRRAAVAGPFLIVALALVLLRANRIESIAFSPAVARPSSDATRLLTPAGRVAFGFPLVVGIAVISPLIAGALPPSGRDRFDPRDLRDKRLQIDDALSPLVELKSQLKADPPAALFRVRLKGGSGTRPDRVRTGALEAYDGALFTSDGEYRRAGHVLAGDPALGGRSPGSRVRMRITILGLRGPFLPAPGRPLRVDGDLAGDRIGFDSDAGTLVSARTDLSGVSYEITSAMSVPSDRELARARPSDPGEPGLAGLASAPPRLPPPIATLAQSWTADATTRAGELLALRGHVRNIRYDDSADAQPGHSYAALTRVLMGDASEREGYAEQLAAAYVVLARARGFPARVATGYLLPEPADNGVITVTEANAHAWPEVHLDGRGWVAIEATGTRHTPAPEPDDAEAPPGKRTDQPNDAAQASPPVPPSIVEPDLDGGGSGGTTVVVAAAAGGLGLVLLALAVVCSPAAAKAWRRQRRRRAASPADRVVGAWRETVDRLVESGMAVSPALTAHEVAVEAHTRFPQRAGAVGQLVPLVGVAVCAPFEPEAAAADRAWHLAGVARSDLRRGSGPVRRVRAAVDPRPLVRRTRGPGRSRRRRGAPAARAAATPGPGGQG
jgi:transglutaminase-like putative cysteine protease